jgi:hypothetical protein
MTFAFAGRMMLPPRYSREGGGIQVLQRYGKEIICDALNVG